MTSPHCPKHRLAPLRLRPGPSRWSQRLSEPSCPGALPHLWFLTVPATSGSAASVCLELWSPTSPFMQASAPTSCPRVSVPAGADAHRPWRPHATDAQTQSEQRRPLSSREHDCETLCRHCLLRLLIEDCWCVSRKGDPGNRGPRGEGPSSPLSTLAAHGSPACEQDTQVGDSRALIWRDTRAEYLPRALFNCLRWVQMGLFWALAHARQPERPPLRELDSGLSIGHTAWGGVRRTISTEA